MSPARRTVVTWAAGTRQIAFHPPTQRELGVQDRVPFGRRVEPVEDRRGKPHQSRRQRDVDTVIAARGAQRAALRRRHHS